MNKKSLLLLIIILLTAIAPLFSAGNPEKEEEGIRDYVCRINVNHHPNMVLSFFLNNLTKAHKKYFK